MNHLNTFKIFESSGSSNLRNDIIDLLTDFRDETDIQYVRTDGGFIDKIKLFATMPASIREAVYQDGMEIRFIRKTNGHASCNEDSKREYLLVDDKFESDSQKISEFVSRLRQLDSQITIYQYWYMDEQNILIVLPKI